MTSLLNKLTGKHDDTSNTSRSTSSASSSSAGSSKSGSTMGSNNPNMGSTTTSQTTTQQTTTTHPSTMSSTTTGTNQYASGGSSGSNMAGMNHGSTDNAMTRSEEQLRVGKEQVGAGKAALDKYVTSEHVQTSVPVTKERVVIEREPINEQNRDAALTGPDIAEAHHEVTLTEERALAAKETVPIERIRLGKQAETHEQQVGADLRKEHVDLTTTGINEKFDNVGYGTTMGKMDTTMNNTSTTNNRGMNSGMNSGMNRGMNNSGTSGGMGNNATIPSTNATGSP